jgi:hypothetical protein
VIRRALIVGLLAAAAAAGAAPSPSEPASSAPYYLARGDPRLCPSPMCGGIWVKRVNLRATVCGDGSKRQECYAASADLSRLRVDEKGRVLLQRLITEGRAVARGTLVGGRVQGFPELDTFVVSEVWAASSSLARPLGVFRRLRDNGVRCITTPCFSIRSSVLNTVRSGTVSDVDLSRTDTPPAERRRALDELARAGLIASGRVVRTHDGGRAVVATQFYVRAA